MMIIKVILIIMKIKIRKNYKNKNLYNLFNFNLIKYYKINLNVILNKVRDIGDDQ